MTQNKLVKIAIDIIIHGKYDEYYDELVLGKKLLGFNYKNSLCYDDGVEKYIRYINFDKTVKNMAMLSILVKDYCRSKEQLFRYEEWIEKGVPE